MKKLGNASVGILVPLLTCLRLFSCNNDDNSLPKGYTGFEHSKEAVEYEGNRLECELEIEIAVTGKAREDRAVVLAAPPLVAGQAAIIQLTEKKIIIRTGKKSATTIIKICPKQTVLSKQSVTLSCTPQWKEGGISKLATLLKRK